MPRKPSCICGECAKCKHRLYMREWHSRGDHAERARFWAQRRYNRLKGDFEWAEKERERNRIRMRNSEKRSQAGVRKRSDPLKKFATSEVGKALNRGDMVKPDSCSRCGFAATGRALQAHHDDYSKPLEVRWLCLACHNEHHVNARREINRGKATGSR